MRTLLSVMVMAATAEAAPIISRPITPVAALPPIEPASVPSACTTLARQANVPRVHVALAARISLAQCIASARMSEHQDLIDAQDSISLLEESVAASFALLDTAIASEDPPLVIEAQHARGVLYDALTARMLATLPRIPANPTDEGMQLREQRAAVLATWLQPWRDKAHESFAAAVAEGRKYQGPIAKDPVATAALDDCKRQLARDAASIPSS